MDRMSKATQHEQCECLSQVILHGSSQSQGLPGILCSLLYASCEMLHIPHQYQGIIFTQQVAIPTEYRQAFLGNGTDGFELLHAP